MGISEDDYDFYRSQYNRSLLELGRVDSAPTYYHFPLFPLGLAIIVVTLLGITGNVISAYVLARKRLRSSSYSVLTLALLCVDTTYLVTKLLRFGLFSLFQHFGIWYQYTHVFLQIYGPYLRPLTFTAHTASTYLTLTIAFDRYLVVSRPHTARRYCTTKQASLLVFVMVVFSILYNIPRWFEYHTITYEETESGESEDTDGLRYLMVASYLRRNPQYRHYYIFWAYLIIMFFLPVVTLTIVNFLLWRGLKRIEKSGLSLSFTQSRDTSFSAMMIGVVVVFLICNLDYLVLDLMDYFGLDYPSYWNYIGNFLLTVNSAVNFLIYCLLGRKFRDELGHIFDSWGFYDCSKKLGTQSQDIFTTTGVWIKDIPQNRPDKNAAWVNRNNE